VQAAKQEDSGETRVVDPPRSRANAGPQQAGKMIDHDIINQTFPRRRAEIVKENVVQPDGLKVAGDGGGLRDPFNARRSTPCSRNRRWAAFISSSRRGSGGLVLGRDLVARE
jgi:hypothetical protein